MTSMRAYSLAEVLVALFLLALAGLGLVSTHLYSLRAQRAGLEGYDSGAAAGSVLASIEADLRQSPEHFARSYAVSDRPLPDLAGAVYDVSEETLTPRLRKFIVTVRAPSQQGPQEFKLWTMVYDLTR